MSASPPIIAGLQYQLDARTLALSDGATVSTWADQTANVNSLSVPSGFAGPIYKTGIIGSNPVVRFNGGGASNHCLTGPLNGWSTGNAGHTHLLLVTNGIYSTAYGRWLSLVSASGTDGTDAAGMALDHNAGANELGMEQGNTFVGGRSGVIPDAPCVIAAGRSATARMLATNGLRVFGDTTASAVGTPTKYFFGQYVSGGAAMPGYWGSFDLAMALGFNRLLTTIELWIVNQWMLTDYGIIAPAVTRDALGQIIDPLDGLAGAA